MNTHQSTAGQAAAKTVLFEMAYPGIMDQIHTGVEVRPETLRAALHALARGAALLHPSLQFDGDVVEAVARMIENRVDITLGEGAVVQKGCEPWLDARRESIDPYYWKRYRRWLDRDGSAPGRHLRVGIGD